MKIGIIMDPLAGIKPHKDTCVAMMLEAQRRGHDVYYMQQHDLHCIDGVAGSTMQLIQLDESNTPWFTLGEKIISPLHDLDVVLMRKDPPFDLEYLYATHLLSLAEKAGVLVINTPEGLRMANEKLFTQWFPEYTPTTLISSNKKYLQSFIDEQENVILKPLNEMGGRSIFHVKKHSENRSVILDTMTHNGKTPIMAQVFIPDIFTTGDKRILMVAGKAIPYGLARIPQKGEFRGNLAAGGTGIGVELTKKERAVCEKIGSKLLESGLIFVGLDMIGGYLTEINVTSPTCLREIDQHFKLNIAGKLFDWIENKK